MTLPEILAELRAGVHQERSVELEDLLATWPQKKVIAPHVLRMAQDPEEPFMSRVSLIAVLGAYAYSMPTFTAEILFVLGRLALDDNQGIRVSAWDAMKYATEMIMEDMKQ